MRNLELLKTALLTLAVIGILLSAACGKPAAENTQQTPQNPDTGTENEQPAPDSSMTEPEGEQELEKEPESDTEPEQPDTTPTDAPNDPIVKINGGADEVGIYSVAVRLTDKAADKGTIEMVYHGAKGSPQENSVVNTFLIKYYKEDAGTFEINTFSDGEVYLNMHHKDEVKVTNTFSATLRAGDVTITYTPDGGDTIEVFSADADYFRASAD